MRTIRIDKRSVFILNRQELISDIINAVLNVHKYGPSDGLATLDTLTTEQLADYFLTYDCDTFKTNKEDDEWRYVASIDDSAVFKRVV